MTSMNGQWSLCFLEFNKDDNHDFGVIRVKESCKADSRKNSEKLVLSICVF